jgi:hypothetical protein
VYSNGLAALKAAGDFEADFARGLLVRCFEAETRAGFDLFGVLFAFVFFAGLDEELEDFVPDRRVWTGISQIGLFGLDDRGEGPNGFLEPRKGIYYTIP